MDGDDSLLRLQNLQRDLIAFGEHRLPTLDRLAAELRASVEDLKQLLDIKAKNDTSRDLVAPRSGVAPDSLRIEDVEYKINENFRQATISVADELNLDELQAAKLCIDVTRVDNTVSETALPFRAILRFHDQRQTVLHCLQLLLVVVVDHDQESDFVSNLQNFMADVIRTPGREHLDFSAYWEKCLAGLTAIEAGITKVGDHMQTMAMTGQLAAGEVTEALDAQRVLLSRQHECLAAVMTLLIRGRYVNHQGFRTFITKTSKLEASLDLTIHYLPIVISGSAYFGSGDGLPPVDALDLHKLFATGPGQIQFKQPVLQSAVTVCWLAEYSARFADTLADPNLRVADRQKAEEERAGLFFSAVRNKAFHFLLGACAFLNPEVWHNPARIGLVEFLMGEVQRTPHDAPPPSTDFTKIAMGEFQTFAEAFVFNMPDVLRRLKLKEDDRRRENYSKPASEAQPYEPDLERFMTIMSYAYQNDSAAAQDFWSDREGNLNGFVRWASQRLPTPRVAAFCDLLSSLANNLTSANHVHRFLLEDTAVVSGKLRKTYSVSWSQIFNELDTFVSSIKDKPATTHNATPDSEVVDLIEGETGIMLESYLRLATHISQRSPEARSWILREQTFPLADVLFQLASSSIEPRIQACCFDLLGAMLTEKVPEVNDGMWVMLDSWISGGGMTSPNAPRIQPSKSAFPERYYLQRFNDNPETAAAFVDLLSVMIYTPVHPSTLPPDALPFPENLGVPHRHAGIDSYVDFVIGTSFRFSTRHSQNGYDESYVTLLRFRALEFIVACLATFNEDLVLLANVTSLSVDSAMRASSLAAYVRLHPFARTMQWLFNNQVIEVLFLTIQNSGVDLDALDGNSPTILALLKAVQTMNLAMQLQSTFFNIVRPIIRAQSPSDSEGIANAAFASFDQVMFSRPDAVANLVWLIGSKHLDLGLTALDLLQRLAQSKHLRDNTGVGRTRTRLSNSLIGLLAERADPLALSIQNDFSLYEHDFEHEQMPPRLARTRAILDLLVKALEGSPNRPTIAHCLLGFTCLDQSVVIGPDSLLNRGQSLLNQIVEFAATGPVSIIQDNKSWLMGIKRGCLEVILRLVSSPLTTAIVTPLLRQMDFLPALSRNQIPALLCPFWDSKNVTDPEALLTSSADAIRDFLRIRDLFCEYATLELRASSDERIYSVQENVMAILRGGIRIAHQEHVETMSVFDLFDFFDLEPAKASDVAPNILFDLDLSVCVKGTLDGGSEFDLKIAEQLLILRKREILLGAAGKSVAEEQQLDDEIRAILASLRSRNSHAAIQKHRLGALESWTDLLSLMLTTNALEPAALATLALQALQVAIPKFERSLAEDIDSAPFLAKLTLTLVPAILPSTRADGEENTIAVYERLFLALRVSLKAITDAASDLALRDVCYRTCCSILGATPLVVVNGKISPTQNAKQLLQLVQIAGERLFTVLTEDVFSDRGSTRVSAVLCLDALVALFQSTRSSSLLMKILSKLNFIPVLIDTSVGSVVSTFQKQNEDRTTSLAYFFTSLALLTRICQTGDGANLVLNSGFFDAVAESRLFSTDPDIGLDIDNDVALREFYRLLSAVLHVIIAAVVSRGPNNITTMQLAKNFLQQNRSSLQAIFKRTSSIQKTAGPPEQEVMDVADDFGKLMFVTNFLEDDSSAYQGASAVNGFT